MGVAPNWKGVVGAVTELERKANGLVVGAESGCLGVLGCALTPNWNRGVALEVPPADDLVLPNENGLGVDCCPVVEKLNPEVAPEVAFAVEEAPGALSAAGDVPWGLEEPNARAGPVDCVKENGLLMVVPGTANGLEL